MPQQEEDEKFLLDEENEEYGFALYNPNQNTFLNLNQYADVHTGYFENDQVAKDKEDIKKAFLNLAKDEEVHKAKELSHIRIVRIHLDNELDKEAVHMVDELVKDQ